jgi:hypothetical protein
MMNADYFRGRAARIRVVMAECQDIRVARFLDELAKEFEERAKRNRSRKEPGDAAAVSGIYAQMNAKGARTGVRTYAAEGDPLPGAPPGFTWLFVRKMQ